jgi:ATP-dependent DNA helicase RecQ
MSDLRAVLRDVWGYDSFRPLQEPAMRAVLEANDSLVVLPTGGGKSICFQAPALLRPGTAVVISPLIALMRDQVAQLRQAGVDAGCLHSGQPGDERAQVVDALRAGVLKLLYLSPERIALENLTSILGASSLSFVAIDEAHCVSMWGHDFRPEYRQIARLREQFPDVDMHAFTATATREVSRDIVDQLALRTPLVLRGSFDRPNLFYAAKPRRGGFDSLLDVVRRHPNQAGIVYCISRRETESVAANLSAQGFKAVPYHAGMNPEDRMANQEAFVADRVNIVVATIAFGMGINKPDVRFVVHMGMPKSIENYQQESGRAGRDGLPAECLLLYSLGDLMTWKKIGSEAPPELQVAANQQLNRIHGWCESTSCRRTGLLAHFDEKYPRANCGMCDNCTGGQRPVRDSHVIAQKILSCIKRLEEQHNAATTTDVLLGSTSKKLIEAGHDKLSTYGLLKGQSRNEVLDWIEQLRAGGFLAAGEGGKLGVTETGWSLLRNRTTGILLDRLTVTAAPPKSVDEDLTPEEIAAFGRLRALRKEVAEKQKIPPYMIFGDVTLRDIVRKRPRNLDELLRVKGVGKTKRNTYGKMFLEALWEGAPPAPAETEKASAVHALSDPKSQAMALFAEELPIAEIAQRIGRAVSTTEGYLLEYIQHQGITDPGAWVPPALAVRIEAALAIVTDRRIRPVFDALDGEATFQQIRLVQACLQNRTEQ